jgi:signal transduction histidine kinase
VTIVDARGRTVAGDGDGRPRTGEVELSLLAYGHPVGALRYQPPVSPLRTRDRRLLDVLAGHLGGLLHAHELTNDLQRALERVVVAREEERRRLRRDLHDGVGPALAGNLLRLDLIADTLDGNSTASVELATLREELRATVLEVRRVVEGLRPPVLDELGLPGALAEATQRLTAGGPLTVDLQVGELPHLPAAIEVAAFRIVTEAITNTARHSGASACRVNLDVVDGLLRITIDDDGRGIDGRPPLSGGHGLQTMRERAEELRGQLRVSSASGTTIVAELPLPRSARTTPAQPRIGARR